MANVELTTSKGVIQIELDEANAPVTTENFLAYVNDGFFDETIFHRVIPNFMVQGGGFVEDMTQKPTKSPITNEANNGLSNKRGTLAMARTNDPESATAQFFVNVKDNGFLDYSEDNPGYAVFGKVTEGMDIVDAIVSVDTTMQNGMQDVPAEPIFIDSAKVV